MPSGISNIDLRFPNFTGKESQDQKMRMILDYLYMLREYLQYLLHNLSPDNFNQTALDGLIDEIRAGVVIADTMISNTVITNNLYAEYGNIAELTVDRLMTDDKVEKYLAADISDVNYVKIQDQTISFITASTDGSVSAQLKNRNDELLYWNEIGATAATFKTIGMTTTPTLYPVYIYDYKEQVKGKMSFDLDADTGYYLPKITLGAGSSTTNTLLGKSYIWKDTTGMTLRYTKMNGVNVDLHIGEDGITGLTGNDTRVGIQLAFSENSASVTVETAESILGSIPVSVSETTDVPIYVSLTGTPADATHLAVKIYLDNVLNLTRKFAALTTDEQNFCCTGILQGIAEGDHTVTFKAAAADADLAVAAAGFLGYALIPGGAYQSYAEGEIAYYELDDAADSGSLGLDTTAYGTVTYAAGRVGNCAVFDGASWLHIQNSMLTDIFWDFNPFSLSGWFKTTYTAKMKSLIAVHPGGKGYDSFKLSMNQSAGAGKVDYRRENGAAEAIVCTTSAYADGAWHMFVAKFDGDTMTLVMDGGAETKTADGSGVKNLHPVSLRIGSTDHEYREPNQASTLDEEFIGSLDQIRFYNYALSTDEIVDLWNGGAGI